MAGRAGGALKTGQHWQFSAGTPIANLWLTILQACNVPQPRFADSTRLLTEILS
jgi:hypothetical protein